MQIFQIYQPSVFVNQVNEADGFITNIVISCNKRSMRTKKCVS